MVELWTCPACGERFTTRNQWHSCGTFDLDALFARSRPVVREIFDRFLELVEDCGPAKVIPQKTRIAIQVEMRFAALYPQVHALRGGLVLARAHDSECFDRVETFSPRNHLHSFRLTAPAQVEALRPFVAEAYAVGERRHLRGG